MKGVSHKFLGMVSRQQKGPSGEPLDPFAICFRVDCRLHEEGSAQAVCEAADSNEDDIHQPPDAEHAPGEEPEQASAHLAYIEAVDSQVAPEDRQEQGGEFVLGRIGRHRRLGLGNVDVHRPPFFGMRRPVLVPIQREPGTTVLAHIEGVLVPDINATASIADEGLHGTHSPLPIAVTPIVLEPMMGRETVA